ncbi:MAG: CPBP family intramembrane glutamic endopeptidase [Chloroflexota bacterium]
MTTRPLAAAPPSAVTSTETSQLSTLALLALHIIPGALMTAGFVLLAPVVGALGFPPIAALLTAIVVILVPTELGVVLWAARREDARVADLIPYRRGLPAREWAVLVPTLVVIAFLGFGLLQAIEPAVLDRFFGWLPAWYVSPISLDRIGDYSASAWIVTLAAYLAINGLVGPIVEELYFRGYLLPRMERLGRWAPLVNVSLFSLYHFWSPWQVLARIVGLAPMVYAVRWKQNIFLGMAVHCTLNTLSVLIVAALVLGRI